MGTCRGEEESTGSFYLKFESFAQWERVLQAYYPTGHFLWKREEPDFYLGFFINSRQMFCCLQPKSPQAVDDMMRGLDNWKWTATLNDSSSLEPGKPVNLRENQLSGYIIHSSGTQYETYVFYFGTKIIPPGEKRESAFLIFPRIGYAFKFNLVSFSVAEVYQKDAEGKFRLLENQSK